MSTAALASLLSGGVEAGARADLATLLRCERAAGPLLLRLAFHDALTYDARDSTGGCNGSIRTKKELSQPGNEGLDRAVELLAPIKAKHPALTFADLIQLAGVCVVAAAGGPPVPYERGRADSWAYAPPGRLFAPASHARPDRPAALRAFACRTGLGVRHVVALAAAHGLGRWWGEGSAALPADAWPESGPPPFNNAYFVGLLAGAHPDDAWLLDDPELALLAGEYAASEAALTLDYAAAHEELARLGTRLGGGREEGGGAGGPGGAWGGGGWVAAGVAAAGVAAAVVGGVVWWRRRRAARGLR